MSFSFQGADAKKDEEEKPAGEKDPLLPPSTAVRPRESPSSYLGAKNSSSSSSSTSYERNSKRGLRARRSPPQSALSSGSNKRQPKQTRLSEVSQMIRADDEINAQDNFSRNQQQDDDDDDSSNNYVDLMAATSQHEQFYNEGEGQASSALDPPATTRSLASHSNADDELSQHRYISPADSIRQYQQQGQKISSNGSAASHRSQQRYNEPPQPYRPTSPDDQHSLGGDTSGSQPQPLLEIPEEIYAVRKSALKVLKPLTKTWIVISVGFSLTVLFGMARWTRLLPTAPFWFILFPCWASHVGLLWLHVLSAKALSGFIAEANDSRQRPDSRDHLNRTEYLPLLQRSLKFGLKTGVLSFFVFLFEILMFIRLTRKSISLSAAFIPLWLLVAGGIFDGFVCKTQHFLRVICWLLSFTAMLLLVLKIDYERDEIRWRFVVFPVVLVLSVASGSLMYIVYGHQIGFYKLTEAQLTAGNLYALASLICIILVVMIGEVIPLSRPVEVETRLFVVVLAPLVVCLTGMGAWVVSRDEFSRLLLYGGQAAVHPKRLRWVPRDGWTCVQGKGVTVIPMFGEVSFQPLERKATVTSTVEMFRCCTSTGCCYPYQEDDEDEEGRGAFSNEAGDLGYQHPYLDPSHSN
mmetsp:Transcript_6406/g.18022  ORF Transcript_6406/g.18022 Transcript_6406/m.18022 type:complete len:636 (-) Transcript_6406:1604-3511(-)